MYARAGACRRVPVAGVKRCQEVSRGVKRCQEVSRGVKRYQECM